MVNAKQLGIAIVGLLIGGGFAFGGIASYAGITNSQQQSQQDFNRTLPSNNFVQGDAGLNTREQMALAYQNDVVLLNIFYDTQQQKDNLSKLQTLPEEFNNRLYILMVNSSSTSDVMVNYGVSEYPAGVMVAGPRTVMNMDNLTEERVSEGLCNSVRNLGSLAAKCIG